MLKVGLVASVLFGSTALATPHRVCGTPQVAPVSPRPSLFAADHQRVLYLNRFGGKYNVGPGDTNSATNVVNQMISQGPTGPITIAPMEAGFDWPTVAKCVVDAYKKYNIRIVESVPKDVGAYVEAVVGGDGTELGFPVGELFGIASADNFCSVTEAGIAFSFSKTHQGVPQKDGELCATIAHEVGHLLALEHEVLPEDMLSYVLVSQSSSKSFVNADSTCGTEPGAESGCSCQNTGGKTNSSSRLNQFVGVRPVETNKPSLTVTSPSNNSNVSSYFEVVAKATDAEGMADVRVIADGQEVGNSATAEADGYHIQVKVKDGMHALTVIARDLAGNEDTKMVMVTSRAGETGDVCVADESCKNSLCKKIGDDRICTQTCSAAAACPDGFACDDTSMLCTFSEDGGGCCSVGNDGGAAAMLLGLGVGLTILRTRRAPRRDTSTRS